MDIIIKTILIGIGATIIMDCWAFILKTAFNITSLNYQLVGRWIGHFPKGNFSHQNILNAKPVKGEAVIGWSAHYLIGIMFAALLVFIWGETWTQSPSLLPAIGIGLITTIAPFFIMQPSFGIGIAASKTPKPNIARIKSLQAHLIYGLGLYITAWLLGSFEQLKIS